MSQPCRCLRGYWKLCPQQLYGGNPPLVTNGLCLCPGGGGDGVVTAAVPLAGCHLSLIECCNAMCSARSYITSELVEMGRKLALKYPCVPLLCISFTNFLFSTLDCYKLISGCNKVKLLFIYTWFMGNTNGVIFCSRVFLKIQILYKLSKITQNHVV